MKTILSGTITLEDLKSYFKNNLGTPAKNDFWRSGPKDNGGFHAESDVFEVDLDPKGANFFVKISAIDDPSDSAEEITDDPAGFIVEFLKTGSAGDEVFGKMASLIGHSGEMSPRDLSKLLRFIASEVLTHRVTKRTTSTLIRHACVLNTQQIGKSIQHVAKMATRIATGSDQAESEYSAIKELQREMTGKGWKTEVSKDDRGMPQIEVNISGIYEATIIVDHIMWHYSFQVKNYPDTLTEGITDDPIPEFRNFFNNPDFQP